MTSTSDVQPTPAAATLQLVRGLFHLVAVASVTVWGFVAWPLPLPGLLTGFGFLALSVLLWALFLSPRPVLRTDRFAQALFELLLLAAAVAALLALGVFWVAPAIYGVAGAVVGYLASNRRG
ncbi:hypothetical protein H490_0104830 [Leucobacter sp. UCD-THU]|uniref:DUF2568 domain-containing protein n=1 Tax=Leucobacter muris TaxID=1935379 RepID=A0ABX5QHP5_9MICO|nr:MULTISPECIES: DUF2568 domain-containing protein [Leucobacter]EYT55937.1 hypothetical protein H490_0104830 [Leucobacter sp. UCD-THU]QAB18545.1 DUF2568 domain-containing protein [Leucobacter muris]